jgi:hypothetical protein
MLYIAYDFNSCIFVKEIIKKEVTLTDKIEEKVYANQKNFLTFSIYGYTTCTSLNLDFFSIFFMNYQL